MNGKNLPGQKVNNKRETSSCSLRVFNRPFAAHVDTKRLNQPNIM